MRVRVEDSNGQALPGHSYEWRSLDPDTATVAASGIVSGHAYGRARIVAILPAWQLADTARIDVRAPARMVVSTSGGTLYRTVDGGGSWTQTASGRFVSMWEVIFGSDSLGLAASGTVIMRSIDGGTSWTPRATGAVDTIADITFLDAETVVAVGQRGTILRSTDAGLTWESVTDAASTNQQLMAVAFASTNVGVAVGYRGTLVHTGVLLRTTDGGRTWSAGRGPASLRALTDVTFSGELAATAVGVRGEIIHTTDGGGSWVRGESPVSTDLWGVRFFSASVALAAGNDGVLLRTTDGGGRWSRVLTGTSLDFRALDVGDARTGIAVGETGAAWVTTDGGFTWTDQSERSSSDWWGVSFVPAWRR